MGNIYVVRCKIPFYKIINQSIDADEQITSLKSDYEALKKKINDIESKSL